MVKTKKILPVLTVALAAAVVCAVPRTVTANANSGPSHWNGVTATGVLFTGEECPIGVESEVLTFNIPDFIDYSSTQEQLLGYRSDFTAEYTFKNPTPNTVNATLAFPLGERSEYGYYEEDNPQDGTTDWQNSFVYLEDALADKYKVFVDGVQTDAQLRRTYHGYYNFDFDQECSRIYDGYRPHEFFSREMPVYIYNFDFTSDDKDNFYADATFTTPAGVRFASSYGSADSYGNETTLGWSVKNGKTVTLYSIGGELDTGAIEWNFYKWTGYWNMRKTAVKAQAAASPKVEQTTFESYVFAGYTGGNGIERSDFYNAALDYIDSRGEYSMMPESFAFLQNSSAVMSWLVYDLSFSAGQTVKNTVTAPLFSGGYYYYDPFVYTYEYLLSPAQSWNGFKSLEIRVNTPYYMVESNLVFEKTDYGYAYKADGLPQKELDFEMCTVEQPERTGTGGFIILYGVIILLLAIPAVVCLGFAIWGIVVLAKGGKKAG